MVSRRQRRAEEAVREVIASHVLQLRDPRLGFVTITRVEMSPDLRYAKVLFSVIDREKEAEPTAEGLESARGLLQGLVSKRLELRHTPIIRFEYDPSSENAAEISELIRQARLTDPNPGPEPDEDESPPPDDVADPGAAGGDDHQVDLDAAGEGDDQVDPDAVDEDSLEEH